MGALMMVLTEGRWNDGRYRMHDDNGFGWIMLALMLVLVAGVVVLVIALLRGTTLAPGRGSGTGGRGPDAKAILQDRFARGEIDEDDYRARVRALEETGG